MALNMKKSVFQEAKEDWMDKKQRNKNIGLYSTNALYKQIGYAISKLELYINLEQKLNENYYFLNPEYARMMVDSLMINIFNIVEILDLNCNYANKIYKFDDINVLKDKPLIVWYLIGTYMKHSYKNYLPVDIQYHNINWKKKYDIVFDNYVDHIVIGNRNKRNWGQGLLSEELFKRRKDTFKSIYLYWYDYLYVRFFNWDDEIHSIISKAADNANLTDKEKEKALEFNKAKRAKTKEVLKYFKWLYSFKSQDKDKPLTETYLYTNSKILWELYIKNKD